MENAADALKTALAVFVFITALSMVFSLIGEIKQTSDAVLYTSDKTTYYDWLESDIENGRIVGEDTVIASLYNSSKDLTYIYIRKNGATIYEPASGENIEEVIKNHLGDGKNYRERVVEVTTGGQYILGEDGTEATKIKGKTKIYIFYEMV